MRSVSPVAQDLARRLLAFEALRAEPSDTAARDVMEVCEKLRVELSKFMGVTGFASLLARALVLAQIQAPSLMGLKVQADGTLQGYDQADTRGDPKAGCILIAQLLDLLVTFIGESLTLRIVSDIWPNVSLDGIELGAQE